MDERGVGWGRDICFCRGVFLGRVDREMRSIGVCVFFGTGQILGPREFFRCSIEFFLLTKTHSLQRLSFLCQHILETPFLNPPQLTNPFMNYSFRPPRPQSPSIAPHLFRLHNDCLRKLYIPPILLSSSTQLVALLTCLLACLLSLTAGQRRM